MAPLHDLCCARLPRTALPLLARLRTTPGVVAALTEQHAWVRWEPGDDAITHLVLPIHGAELYHFQEGHWRPLGKMLPTFDLAAALDYRPLAHVLFPAPVMPLPTSPVKRQRLTLTLRRDDQPRPTSAFLCDLAVLASWSDTVPSVRLQALQAAILGEQALVRGSDLPPLSAGDRYWGRDVLVPLGHAPDPALPESAVRQIAGIAEDLLLLWRPDGCETIARGLFSPLTRAGIRLAARLPMERP